MAGNLLRRITMLWSLKHYYRMLTFKITAQSHVVFLFTLYAVVKEHSIEVYRLLRLAESQPARDSLALRKHGLRS